MDGMNIPSHVRQLQEIWRAEYGEDLSDAEALMTAERVLEVYGHIVSVLARNGHEPVDPASSETRPQPHI